MRGDDHVVEGEERIVVRRWLGVGEAAPAMVSARSASVNRLVDERAAGDVDDPGVIGQGRKCVGVEDGGSPRWPVRRSPRMVHRAPLSARSFHVDRLLRRRRRPGG